MSDHTLTILGIILGLVGTGISILSIAIALPGLLQMLRGGPHLLGKFTLWQDQESELLVELQNRPIKSRALLAMGVSRGIADITGDYRIQSAKGHELASGPVTFRLRYDEFSSHLRLAGEQKAYIVVATHDYLKGYAILGLGPEDSYSIPIQTANYLYELNLSIGGKQISAKRWFRFSNRGLSWLDDEPIT